MNVKEKTKKTLKVSDKVCVPFNKIQVVNRKKEKNDDSKLFKRGEELIKILNEGIIETNKGQFIINSKIFLNFQPDKPKNKVKNKSIEICSHQKSDVSNDSFRMIYDQKYNQFKQRYIKTKALYLNSNPKKKIKLNSSININTHSNRMNLVSTCTNNTYKTIPASQKIAKKYKKKLNKNGSSIKLNINLYKKNNFIPKSPESKKTSNITTTRSRSNISISSLKPANLKQSASTNSYRQMSKKFQLYQSELLYNNNN